MPTIHEESGVDFEKPFSVLLEEEKGEVSVPRWVPGVLVTGPTAEAYVREKSRGFALPPTDKIAVIAYAGTLKGIRLDGSRGWHYRQDTEDAYAPRMWEGYLDGVPVTFGPVCEDAIPPSLLALLELSPVEAGGEYAGLRYRPAPVPSETTNAGFGAAELAWQPITLDAVKGEGFLLLRPVAELKAPAPVVAELVFNARGEPVWSDHYSDTYGFHSFDGFMPLPPARENADD